MRILSIDWSSDWTLLMAAIFVVCLVAAILMDRISPKGKKRQAARTVTERPGEIID